MQMKYKQKDYPDMWVALKVITQEKFDSDLCFPDMSWAVFWDKRRSEMSGALPIPSFEQKL